MSHTPTEFLHQVNMHLPAELLAQMQQAWLVRQENFAPTLVVSRPTDTESISVTGSSCALHCAHCNGHYLGAMTPLAALTEPADLHGRSCLISGGCTPEGKVPVAAALTKLAALKGNHRYNFHVGLVSEEEIKALAPLADVVSFDFVGDDVTIRETLKLHKQVADYVNCYRLLRRYCRKVVPHICIGLHGGKLSGEAQALALLQQEGLSQLVFIVLRPTPGTEYAHVQPPDLAQVARFFCTARLALPKTPLILGCMRPGGSYRQTLDLLALACGLNGIVQPAPAAVHMATDWNLKIQATKECCAF
ncbi:MAG: hypothetical protein LKF34_04380 [Acidaminococcaceae bacterium]|jgi:uncharacterized radical SAM superfamily protein|nr:hypothetical protein [Acidaminococcaceae bacterium]